MAALVIVRSDIHPRSENNDMTSRDPSWQTRLGLLTMAHMLGTLHSVSVLAMAPVIRPDLDLNFAQFGLLMTAYSAGQFTGAVPAGVLVDRIGVGRALMCAHFVLTLGAIGLSFSDDFYTAFAAVTVMGLGYSIMNPATARGVLEWFPLTRRGTAMGTKQTGVPIGGVIAASTLAIAQFVHWQSILLIIAAVTFVGGLACIFLVQPRESLDEEVRPNVFRSVADVVKNLNFTVVAATSGICNVGQYNFFTFLTLYMREAVLASQELASTALGVAQGASAVGRMGWGFVADTVFRGSRKTLSLLICGAAAVFLVIFSIADSALGIAFALTMAVMLGLTIASFASLLQTAGVESVERSQSGAAVGCMMLSNSFGAMIGPPIFGAIVDATGAFASGWLVSAAIVGLGVLLFWRGFSERPQ